MESPPKSVNNLPPSSSGPGYWILSPVTGVRLPLGVLAEGSVHKGLSAFSCAVPNVDLGKELPEVLPHFGSDAFFVDE